MNLLKKIFGTNNDRELTKMRPLVERINSFSSQMEMLSDEELKAQTPKLRQVLNNGASLDTILPEAFATVREAAKRVIGERHYDVQLMGGIVLSQGKIAEMKTGEGKTLTSTLPLYLHGLTQKGAHCVTVNDYLAKRDSEWMGQIFEWLGMSVGCVISHMEDQDRQKAYAADITYGTNNEFAFDYLRDNMKFDLEHYVQRGHNYCIVDEVDSILIDEARTPLLISGMGQDGSGLFRVSDQMVRQLQLKTHFTIEEKSKTAILTDDGVNFVQEKLKIDDLFALKHSELLHHLNQSLRAHHLFKKDVDYIVKNDKVVIVDEFTGRLKEGSNWSDGLHQAVEAKEGVKIKSESQTLASITFQNYFKLYNALAGMTGTAETEAEEFRKIYKLEVMVIPTNVAIQRQDMPDSIYKNRAGKYRAMIHLIKELYQKGQPVLVGTISIDSSEYISSILKQEKIPHNVLNAKHHEQEAEIIANAGIPKAVTIATNMAGRGTDIKLTPQSREVGGLFIIGTERHEARRIDNQLRGRSGRQGDPGASKFFLSLEDDLMRIFGSERIQGMMETLKMDEDEPIEHKMISNAIAKAQKKVETHHFEIRKHLLDYDNVINEQRKVIYRIRRDILGDKDNMGLINEMVEDVIENLVETFKPEKKVPIDQWPWSDLEKAFHNTIHLQQKLDPMICSENHSGDISDYLISIAKHKLDDKFSKYEADQIRLACREILLSIFDSHWKDHMLRMDHLKEGINLRAYAQKDPLNEYKRESYLLFEEMKLGVKKAVIDNMFSVQLYTKEEIEELKRRQQEILEAQLQAHKNAQKESAQDGKRKPLNRVQQKVGRNDPCPCGSGKKFKQCHGA